ncbi:MAG: response regulator [Oscillospiraceae bacterium]|nr:response regulator [Oscillospiraceae bacterium]
MKHLKVRTKLMAGFLIVTALCVVVGAVGIIGMNRIKTAGDSIYVTHMSALPDIAKAIEYLERMRIQLQNLILADGDPEEISTAKAKLADYGDRFLEHTSAYGGTIVLPRVRLLFEDAVDVFTGDFVPGAGKLVSEAEAGGMPAVLKEMLNNTNPAANMIVEYLTECMEINISLADDLTRKNLASFENIWKVIFAVLCVVTLLSLLISLYISGLISKPLTTLSAFMRKAGTTGELSLSQEDIENISRFGQSRDEIGDAIAGCALFIKYITDVSWKLEGVAEGDLGIDTDVLSDADTIGNSLKKMVGGISDMIRSLNRKNELTDTLNRAAAIFISREHETFEGTMSVGVRQIAGAAKLDRVTVWRNFTRPDGEHGAQIYRWDRESGGTTEPTPGSEDIHYSKLAPLWVESFLNGTPVNGPIHKIPYGELLRSSGVASVFIQPVFISGRFWGAVIFEDHYNERYFEADVASMLRSAAFLCANTVIREEMEREIIQAEALKKTREADEFARLIFETVPVSCDLWDEDGSIVDCNEEALKLFGVRDKEEYRRRFAEFSPETQPDGRNSLRRVREIVDTVLNDGFFRFNWLHNDADGTPIPVVIHAKRIMYQGRYVAASYKYDMREELRTQEQARKAEKRTKLLFDSMPLCGCMWADDLSILDSNQETMKLFGLPGKLSTSETFHKLSPETQPDGKKSTETARRKLTEAFSGSGYSRFEWLHQTLDGEPLPCEVTLIRSEYNGETVVLSYIRDIREQKKMLAAEAASYAKTAFLSNMSHEMRTPMNAIIGMAAIGKNAADTERKDYAFGKIEDASTHLLGVINDVLDISKIEANMLELSPVEFDFERMLHKVVSVINFRVNEKRQKFSVHVDGKVPRFIVGDDQRLAQVIMNLLSNAVKFTPEQGAIRLDASMTGEKNGLCELRIEVTDTGIGISAEQQDKLFRAFSQAESGISREYGGTGLGLVISKRIVELMGGELWVESEQGEGSRFIFTVRVARGKKTVRNLLSPGINWDTIRVLAVDDMEETREYFKDVFNRLRVKCDVAADGFEALQMIEDNGQYDICFIDWRMPGMDGIELTRRIKARGNGKPPVVIMISAYNWEDIKETASQAGVDKYLVKPLLSSAIMDCVNDCLGLGHKQDSLIDAGDFEGRHILLAEDIELNREIVLALMDGTGLKIDCAENGRTALDMVEAAPDRYDLIFMDVQMPQMDGLTATRSIRALPFNRCKEIPIIAMTADVFKDDIEKCLAAGMNDHIGKPLDITVVHEKLRRYLGESNKVLIPSRDGG